MMGLLWAAFLRGCLMETIVRRCAGLDVHKESVVACARVIDDNGELQLSTQTFGTTMSDLLVLGDRSRFGDARGGPSS